MQALCFKLQAGSLLQAARLVQSMELTDKNDFGDGCHMTSTEPFFYDSAYKLVKKRVCVANIEIPMGDTSQQRMVHIR